MYAHLVDVNTGRFNEHPLFGKNDKLLARNDGFGPEKREQR